MRKKAVLAALCVAIGSGSVMLAKADGTLCPDCEERTVYSRDVQDIVTEEGVECTRTDHVSQCYVDYVYRYSYHGAICIAPGCGYSGKDAYPYDIKKLSERHYSIYSYSR